MSKVLKPQSATYILNKQDAKMVKDAVTKKR